MSDSIANNRDIEVVLETILNPNSNTTRREMYRRWGGRCSYCGIELDPFTFHIDHQDPKSRGGRGTRSNLCPSCPACNLKKGARDVQEYREVLMWEEKGVPSFTVEQYQWLRDEFGISINQLYKLRYGRVEVVEFHFEKMQRECWDRSDKDGQTS